MNTRSNDFTVRPQRADAEKGTVLINEGGLRFETHPSRESGFFAPKDMHALAEGVSRTFLFVGNNNAALSTFSVRSDVQ